MTAESAGSTLSTMEAVIAVVEAARAERVAAANRAAAEAAAARSGELTSRIPPRLLVAIAGSPGAGKSTIAADLVARLPSAALLPMDGFHLPQARLRELGRRDRMGAPDTFDVDGFLRTLTALVENSGDPVSIPGFDREIEESIPNAAHISPEFATVVVEGNYLLLNEGGWERAAAMFDLTFFVEVDREVRLQRLIARHVRFGKSPEEARDWSLGPDESNARLIEATRSRAAHVIGLG